MSNDAVTVVAKDKHSVVVMDAATGNFRGSCFVTSGEIVGQPAQSGNIVTITCQESGKTWVKVYDLPSMNFRRQNSIA